jgi:hypothetical protein
MRALVKYPACFVAGHAHFTRESCCVPTEFQVLLLFSRVRPARALATLRKSFRAAVVSFAGVDRGAPNALHRVLLFFQNSHPLPQAVTSVMLVAAAGESAAAHASVPAAASSPGVPTDETGSVLAPDVASGALAEIVLDEAGHSVDFGSLVKASDTAVVVFSAFVNPYVIR